MAGKVDPSLYIVLLNAKEIGWKPRPPRLDVEKLGSEKVVEELSKTSDAITPEGKLKLTFATSLHERKHFVDLHFSTFLWRYFLGWLYASANIMQIINNLKGKHVKLPIYTKRYTKNDKGYTLRNDLPITSEEKRNLEKFGKSLSVDIPARLSSIFEKSATIIQFSVGYELYSFEDCENSLNREYECRYYLKFFKSPIDEFKGNYDKAFAFYTFCGWFCIDKEDFIFVRRTFGNNRKYVEDIVFQLLKEEFYRRKLMEIEMDKEYLEHQIRYYRPIIVDLNRILYKLILYRERFFGDQDKIIETLSSLDAFISWLKTEGMRVPFLVDFGRNLKEDEEITENYLGSRWIVPRKRFFYYNDHIGENILAFSNGNNEVDDLLAIQHLTNFILNPDFKPSFHTLLTTEDFLGFTYERVED